MSENINLKKSDIGNLFEELESVAKEVKLEEKKRKDYVEASVSEISSLFKNLEKASKEANIEIEEKKSLSKEDQTKLNEFSGLMDSIETIVEKKSEEPPEEIPEEIVEIDPQKEEEKLQALQELFSTITHKEEDELREYLEETQPEEKKVEPTNIIEDIVSKLDGMGKTTEIQEEVDQISKLRKEFENFQNVMQRRFETSGMSGAGGGEVRLEFLDDVDRDTAKVDGKFLKFDSSSGKFVGDDASVSNETIQDVVGNMVSSNTESGITVTYQDGDGTLDFTIGTLNQDTTGNAATATALETGRTINGTSFDGSANITVTAAAGTVTGSTLNSGVTASSLTSVGTLTSLTVDNIIVNGTTIGHTDDTDLITLADGLVTVAGNLTVSGTTTTVNQTVVNVTDAFVFEGANADAHETTFRVDEPTADRKASLQDKTGTIALLSGFKINATDGSASNEGDFIVLDTSADDGDRLLFEDGTTDPIAVLASHGISLSGQGWNAFQFDNG